MSFKIRLPIFEGPFDLLVYLIEHARMSIYDIRISEITGQYLRALDVMREMNVRVSSEFMVLAAELLQIKSRMMLPGTQSPDGSGETEDPRSELAERLLAYKRCRMAGEALGQRQEQMENVFTKPQEDISIYTDNPEEVLRLSPAEFEKAFRAFLHRRERVRETVRRYELREEDRKTLERKMERIRASILHAVREGRRAVRFQDLMQDPDDPREQVVSFLSVLQMVRDRYLKVEQNGLFGEIKVSRGKRSFDDFDARAASEEIESVQQGDDEIGI